jgi:hypothetical protein
MICFPNIDFVTIVGELEGAKTDLKRKKPRIGVLTLHIGNIEELPSIKNRIFDYFTLDFYPENPEVNIVGFVKTDKEETSHNELRKYIYLAFSYFGKSTRRRLYLDGPDLYLGSTQTVFGEKLLKVRVGNSKQSKSFDFKLIIKKGIDPIEIKPNTLETVE